jgi:hypothetical protein
LGTVWPMSELASRFPLPNSTAHAAATIGLSVAAWLGLWWAGSTKPSRRDAFESVWQDFRDFFGMVWGRRVMDRMNQTAAEEGWPVRLHFDGLAAPGTTGQIKLSPDQASRVEQVFRWLLRRFVDPEWIDERMKIRDETR